MNDPEFKELQESIFDLLKTIQNRAGLFIGTPSISRLHAFVVGYTTGLGRVGFTLRDVEQFHRFHGWIARRLGFGESTSGWSNMILEKSESESDAYKRFYELLDEFRKDSI